MYQFPTGAAVQIDGTGCLKKTITYTNHGAMYVSVLSCLFVCMHVFGQVLRRTWLVKQCKLVAVARGSNPTVVARGSSPACSRCAKHIGTSTLWTTARARHQRSRLLLSLHGRSLCETPLLVSLVLVLPGLQRGMAGESLSMQPFQPLSEF
jgi:hypothetical protein